MIAAALLVFVVIAYRVVLGVFGMEPAGWLHNFAPMTAIVLCGAVHFPRRVALAVPLLALFVSDLILNAKYGVSLLSIEMLTRYVALGLVGVLAWSLRENPRFGRTLLASLAGSVIFFLLTNTAAWLTDPIYAKTGAGWVQALTVGHPGFLPTTLQFFRNSLVSDFLFTTVFLVCIALQPRKTLVPQPARREELAPW